MGMRAYELGYKAGEEGQPFEANPYMPMVQYHSVSLRYRFQRENPAWEDWSRGWRAGTIAKGRTGGDDHE